jgi:hypothetical protein
LGNSWVAAQLAASQERLRSMKFVNKSLYITVQKGIIVEPTFNFLQCHLNSLHLTLFRPVNLNTLYTLCFIVEHNMWHSISVHSATSSVIRGWKSYIACFIQVEETEILQPLPSSLFDFLPPLASLLYVSQHVAKPSCSRSSHKPFFPL